MDVRALWRVWENGHSPASGTIYLLPAPGRQLYCAFYKNPHWLISFLWDEGECSDGWWGQRRERGLCWSRSDPPKPCSHSGPRHLEVVPLLKPLGLSRILPTLLVMSSTLMSVLVGQTRKQRFVLTVSLWHLSSLSCSGDPKKKNQRKKISVDRR